MSRITFFIGLAFVFTGLVSVAQITPVMTVSKEKILIGEPFKVTLELKAIDRNATVQWIIPDSIPHFEWISADTTDLFKREITITSFDSGLWALDGITAIVPSNVNNQPLLLKFPAKEVMIEYDTTGNQLLSDIKPIVEIEGGDQWVGYAVAAAALISLLLLIYLFSRWKKQRQMIQEETAKYPALEEFLLVTNELKTKNWQDQSLQKQHFSIFTAAVKRYFERQLKRSFSRLTTDELLLEIKPYLLNDQLIDLAQSLRLADAVKFARFKAPEEECMQAIVATEKLVQQTDQATKKND